MFESMSFHEINKLMEESKKYRVYCKCGSSRIFVAGKNSADKLICPNCGNYIYRNKQIEFKERMKKLCIPMKK